MLLPRVGQKEPPRLGVTARCGPERATESRQFVFFTAKSWPETLRETRQYDLLRPNVGQKEPPRIGSTVCYGQPWARKSHRDSAVRFVTAKCGPERATETRQYDLFRSNVGQKEPPRLGSTICCGQTWARKSHQDSAERFVTAKTWPERATKTRKYNLLRPNVGQKEPPRLGSTICYGQMWARKSHRDSAVRFVTANRGPERVTETRQYDLLRPNMGRKEPPRLGSTVYYGQELATKTRQYGFLRSKVGQKEPPRLVSTICYSQEWARKRHQDSARRFVTAKSWTERATETRQYDLLAPRVGQKEPPRDSAIELARKSQRYLTVRFVTAKSWLERVTARLGSMIFYGQTWPEGATETRQCDLLWPNVGQKEPPRFGSTICYDQDLARKRLRDSAIRFVTAKSGPERATKTRQYDLLRSSVGQKKPPRLGQKEPPRLGNATCYGQDWARKSHRNSVVRFVTAKSWPERGTETRQYDLLRPRVGQKEPPRLGSTICGGQTWARKSHQDSAVLVTAKHGPPRLCSKIYYSQEELSKKSHRNSAVRFVTAKSWPERATETRQYDLLRPNVGQEEPPSLGSTICYGQTWARKSHRDTPVRFVTARRGPERATKTRQYDLLRPSKGQKEPPRLGRTIAYRQTWARTAIKTRQYDLLRPRVGQKEPPRLGSTICGGQTWARKSHQDSAVRLVTAKKSWPERATETRQYDLLRLRVGQKEAPRLGSTIC